MAYSGKEITDAKRTKRALGKLTTYILQFITQISDALEAMDNAKADKPIPIQFNLPISAWKAAEDEGSLYPFYANIPIAGLTGADDVAIKLSLQTQKRLQTSFTGETVAGAMVLMADERPNIDISGTYEIVAAGTEV